LKLYIALDKREAARHLVHKVVENRWRAFLLDLFEYGTGISARIFEFAVVGTSNRRSF
jgi:hypothetical protein